MVTCEICGKEFKNTKGLRGHKNFVHNIGSSYSVSTTQAATEPQLSKLEKRLGKLEYITGSTEIGLLDDILSNNKPLTERLTEVTEQLNQLTQQLNSLSINTASKKDLHNIGEKIAQLTQQLSNYSKWFESVRAAAGTMSRLEDELSNKAQNTRVNSLKNRLRQLEGNKEAADSRIGAVMGLIDRMVDRIAASLKQLQSQLNEQKQVTDWVRREYRLRPVKKNR